MGCIVVALAVALTGCSGDPEAEPEPGPGTSDPPATEVTIDCPEFEATAQKIVAAQTALYSDTGHPGAIADLIAELDALKEGAPADVRAALEDMGTAFRDAARLLEDPSAKGRAELAELAPELSAAAQTITAYVTARCG